MAGYVRVATFDVDEASLDTILDEINSRGGPPEGVPAKNIMVLADRSAGKAVFIVRFDSEEDLRTGNETLNAMNPPTEGMRRISVDNYEVVLERQTP